MRWRERRRAGLTIRNISKVTRELKAAGELEGLGQSEIAAVVMGKILEGNADVMSDPSFDFEGILAFIERILPLILKLLELFGK